MESRTRVRRLLLLQLTKETYMPAFCARWLDVSFSIVDADDRESGRLSLRTGHRLVRIKVSAKPQGASLLLQSICDALFVSAMNVRGT